MSAFVRHRVSWIQCSAPELWRRFAAVLRLRGEKELFVPPLPLPDDISSLERVRQSGAVKLFVERAQNVQSHFILSEMNASTIAQICILLDGLPLAIELTAARCRVLSPQTLLERLADPLNLLTHGSRDLPDRQQTLRTTIAWSVDLLNKTALHTQSLAMFQELELTRDIATAFTALAKIAESREQIEQAIQLLAVADTLRRTTGIASSPSTHMDDERRIATLRTRLDSRRFDQIWRKGESMTVQEAIAYALQDPSA